MAGDSMDTDIKLFMDNLSADADSLRVVIADLIRQLEDSYHGFYQLLSSVPGSFLLFSEDGSVIAASKRMRELFLHNQEVVGKKYSDLEYPFFSENSQDRLINSLIKQSLTKGLCFERIMIESDNYMHDDVLVELNLQVLRGGDGKIRSVLMSFVENVVRLNMLPGNLEKDQKLKKLGSLAAGLVHEIKNPMQSISTIAQLLQRKYPDDKFLQKYLDSAMTEMNRINVILSEYLSFSGTNQEYMTYTHINDICQEVLQITYGNCYLNEIELRTVLPDNIPMMILDTGRIKQVLVNFITNSIDAVNELRNSEDFEENYPDYQGIIEIETEYNYGLNECYIYIRDNGIGMTKETLDDISKPFFTTKKYGTGIGVSISKNIIRNHGGRIAVQSEYGKGTTFKIILPELAGLMEMAVKQKRKNIEEFVLSRNSGCVCDDYGFDF